MIGALQRVLPPALLPQGEEEAYSDGARYLLGGAGHVKHLGRLSFTPPVPPPIRSRRPISCVAHRVAHARCNSPGLYWALTPPLLGEASAVIGASFGEVYTPRTCTLLYGIELCCSFLIFFFLPLSIHYAYLIRRHHPPLGWLHGRDRRASWRSTRPAHHQRRLLQDRRCRLARDELHHGPRRASATAEPKPGLADLDIPSPSAERHPTSGSEAPECDHPV